MQYTIKQYCWTRGTIFEINRLFVIRMVKSDNLLILTTIEYNNNQRKQVIKLCIYYR